jgi:hypothetical protein
MYKSNRRPQSLSPRRSDSRSPVRWTQRRQNNIGHEYDEYTYSRHHRQGKISGYYHL